MTSLNGAAASNGNDVPGLPFYQKTRAHLKELLLKRKMLMRSLESAEEAIYKKETDYLEDTPLGNIITGFDAYTKAQAPGAARRRTGISESNRVFSKSSMAFGSGDSPPSTSAHSTPMQTAAPTPVSASFGKNGGVSEATSNVGTPVSTGSATATQKMGGATKKAGNKRAATLDDSESEAKEGKRARMGSAANRK